MRHASFISRSLSAVGLFFAAVTAHAAVCDVDLDGSIDTADLAVIRAAEQLPVLVGDRRDADGNRFINAADSQTCATRCTRAQCAPIPAGVAVTRVIGPAGGLLVHPGGARIEVPPLALDHNASISIRRVPLIPNAILPPGAVLVTPVYAFEPHGQQFLKPVRITLPYRVSALQPGYSEDNIFMDMRLRGGREFHRIANEGPDPTAESDGQAPDTDTKTSSVDTSILREVAAFSSYPAVVGTAPITLTSPTASITVRRPRVGLRSTVPVSHKCTTGENQAPMTLRAASAIQAIVLHSTNNGSATRTFQGELDWALRNCNQYFAHYYIDRDGTVYQVASDAAVTFHTRPSASLGIRNGNAIGIEMFNNTGEPYDGRLVTATVRLLDYLADQYKLPRPARDPATGTLQRRVTSISQGGDRVVGHHDTDAGKCDPVGNFRSSGSLVAVGKGPRCLDPVPLPGGHANAPSLLDTVLDSLAMLDRSRQHTGVINTQGGDAHGVATPGAGGAVAFTVDAAAVDSAVGTAVPRTAAEHQPLTVAPGATRSNLSGTAAFTDAVIAGTLEVAGDLELRLSGNFYLAPTGRIVLRDGLHGGDLRVLARGLPVVQGLIDTRGTDGPSEPSPGGNGGAVLFAHANAGNLLVPTAITRGGDADTANVTLSGGGPRGGRGGDITVMEPGSAVVVGGGIGPRINDALVPPLSATPPPPGLPAPPLHVGDFLPPAPPILLSSA